MKSRLVPLSVAALKLGVKVRVLMQEIELCALAGVQRRSGIYIDVDELRSYLAPGGRR